MITYLLPTRDRRERLRETLAALDALDRQAHDDVGGAEVIVIDNASQEPVGSELQFGSGLPLRVIRLNENAGAAARNVGARVARGEWIIMLDDDSFPLSANHLDVVRTADDDIAAIGAEILLPSGARESGGLPEVFIGCGVAVRRTAFVQVGGYDPMFDYYAEEYDLCAKLLLNGWRTVHDRRFQVRHDKVRTGRDMDRILHYLVRNNCWVAQRYSPREQVDYQLHETISRYAGIAVKERAARGFARGMAETLQSLVHQPRFDMSRELFDRFTGLRHVRESLSNEPLFRSGCGSVAIVDEGKNAWVVRQVLNELDVEVVGDWRDADALVVGTLSPGPMLDALESVAGWGKPVILPWHWSGVPMKHYIGA